jgi:pimeloyl-ACP methyl ester carboxylesterase
VTTPAPTIVIVPGFNEPDKDMNSLADGRRGIPGLRAGGYECRMFPVSEGTLSERIDKFGVYLDALKTEVAFPIISLGYSLGGLVTRGFLRRYPERATEVLHTITLGSPHWGMTVDILPMLSAFLHLKDRALRELDVRSDFMRWLNGTGGHWEGRGKDRNWILDAEPWPSPPGSCVFSIYGAVPHFGGDNDGIVWKDSATLGGRLRSSELKGELANHLNLIGAWNPLVFLIKGFMFDDKVWPEAIARIADHIVTHVAAGATVREEES